MTASWQPAYPCAHCPPVSRPAAHWLTQPLIMVSFHNFKSQNFKLSVSNPKRKYVAYVSVLSQISNCQGLGRKNKHEILKTDRTHPTAVRCDMVSHQAFRARRVRTTGIGGEVRHGVTSGVLCETSLNKHVTPHLHREHQESAEWPTNRWNSFFQGRAIPYHW